MFDARILPILKTPLRALARIANRAGFSANQVTLAGFVLGIGAVVAVAFEYYLAGLALLLANRLADGIDGELARLRQPTDAGAYLDIVLDFIFYSAFVFAFILAAPEQNALPGGLLMLSFMGTGGSFLAFATLAQKRGIQNPDYPSKSLHYMGGITEGGETIAFMVLFCLFPAWFDVLAYIFAGLCIITAMSRIYGGFRALK
ncbi:MAG: CDP-alcohol phosphatidyltransferase family protein [Idiomarina sp.]|nr:CDP-alcohol phosphatidyltransferase family protein [Idiomarina sp.]